MTATFDDLAISVVMPVYLNEISQKNVAALRRALSSVHEQNYASRYEILIVDDGSTLPIENLADVIGRDFLAATRFVTLPRNGGISAALNRGIREARYPLIARLDCDDRWYPTKIEKQLALFASDPDLSVTATGMTRVDADGKLIDTHIRPGNWRGILRFFVEIGCPFPHGSVVARKETYLALGGYPQDPRFRHCEDFALWGRWLRFFKPAMIEEPLYEYTVSDGSVSGLHSAQQARATGLVIAAFQRLDLTDTLPQAIQDFAIATGLSPYLAGLLAYTMWQYGVSVRLPRACLPPLRSILPDCHCLLADDDDAALDVAEIVGSLGRFPADCSCTAIRR